MDFESKPQRFHFRFLAFLVRIWMLCGIVSMLNCLDAQPLPVPLVAKVQIEGYKPFSLSALTSLLQTETNRRLFGTTPWLNMYRRGQNSNRPKWLRTLLQKGGEPPAFLDLNVLEKDRSRLELFFQQQGYRKVRVDAMIHAVTPDSEAVNVLFQIQQGDPTYLRNFKYQGLEILDPDQQQRLLAKSVVYPSDAPQPLQKMSFKGGGQRYMEPKFYDERRRILNFLQDEGFAEITRDSVKVLVVPVRPDSFDVTMNIKMGRRFRVGNVQFSVVGQDKSPVRVDTLVQLEHEGQSFNALSQMSNEDNLKSRLLRDLMTFYPSEWFSQTRLLATKSLLEQTGLFPFSNYSVQWQKAYQSKGTWYVPLVVDLRTRERHQGSFEGAMLQREDLNGNSEFGLGAGASYRNLNVLGRGEQVQVRVSGSGTLERNSPTTQLETSFSGTLPYPVFPFQHLSQRFSVPDYNTRTRLVLNFLTSNRQALKLKIRSRIALQYRFEMKHNQYRTSIVDAVDFSVSDPDTLTGFQKTFLSNIQGLNANQRQRILEDYTVQKINNAFRYVMRVSNTDLLRRETGYLREYGAEIGGNLPFLIDRFVQSPDVVQGSIRWFNRSGRLSYRPYTRAYVDIRRYYKRDDANTIAGKFFVGWAQPIGKKPDLSPEEAEKFQFIIPFERRFFIGGASSLRAWGLGELGPGENTQNGFLGGDIKIETSIERRVLLAKSLFSADWSSAFFVDAGNIWNGRRNDSVEGGKFRFDEFYKQIAVGSGAGLRIAWAYFILRLDFAVKVYAPNTAGIFPQGIRPKFVLGLGQAF